MIGLAGRFKFLLYFGSDVSREFPDVIGGAVKAVTACVECGAVNANHPTTNTVKQKSNNKKFGYNRRNESIINFCRKLCFILVGVLN